MITKNSIENLKNNIDIVDTISSYIQLNKSGTNYKACCPFHDEQTPSFVVSPAKQIYHCFGCGVGGDSIKFVMEIEKLNYPEALEKLASSNNIALEYEDKNYKIQDISMIDKLNDFYIKQLDTNDMVISYLKQRGLSNSTIETFKVGYASSSNDTINFLKTNMLNLSDAKEFGLIDSGENGLYARFIHRVTFPIYTTNGKICGFGGRTITDNKAKYINSPQSKIFNKSRLLYGYHIASKYIYKQKQIIITEGYLDVLMLHQAGFTNCVASLGTALTKEHLPLLSRGEPEVILAYDGDKAGLVAAKKASIMLSYANFDGGVVIFDDGIDPADMVKNSKIDELNHMLKNKISFVKFVINMIVLDFDLSNPVQKREALTEIQSYLNGLNSLIQDEYKSYISQKLNIDQKHINIKTTHRKREHNTNIGSQDLAELCIIKTALNDEFMLDKILNLLHSDMFVYHKQEFDMLTTQKDNHMLLGILLRDELKPLNQEELDYQIDMMIYGYYQRELQTIKNNPNLNFQQKAKKLKDIQENIKQIKSNLL